FGDRIDAEQAVLAALLKKLRPAADEALAVDTAVDHHVRDMHAQRPELARHALRDHAQPGLGDGELGKSRFAAQAARRTGEDHRAAPEGDEPTGRLAPDEEAGEAADAPEILELLGGELAEVDALIVAGVEDDDIGRLAPATRRHRPIEQGDDVALARRIGGDRFGAAA